MKPPPPGLLLAAALLATGCTPGAGIVPAATPAPLEQESAGPSAADLLAALPDGEQRRRFILDCTGCHTFREDLAYPAGHPRTAEAWAAAVESMTARFGPHSGFPVIGPGRDVPATARWLAESLPARPPRRQVLPPERPLHPRARAGPAHRSHLRHPS